MKKLLSYLRISLLDSLTYRGDLFLYTVSGVIQPLVNIFVWLSISGHSSLPLSRNELIQYFLWVMVVGVWTAAWAGQFIGSDIRTGKFSLFLLRPVSFLYYQLGNNIGEKIFKTIFLFPLLLVLIFSFGLKLPAQSLAGVLLLTVILISAATMAFVIDACLGLAAFWFEDSSALEQAFIISAFFFSGKFLPLAVLPETIRHSAIFLPFRYTLSFPIEVILGQLNPAQIRQGFGIQLIWLILIIIVYRLVWIKGTKRYSAAGA